MTASLTSGRRATLVLGLPLSLAFVGWGSLSVVNVMGLHAFSQSQVVTPQVHVLSVKNQAGSVRLATSPDGRVHVTAHGHETTTKPHVGVTSTAAGVVVSAGCPGVTVVVCEVILDVSVPAGFTVTAQSAGGDVNVGALSAASLDLHSTAGDVHGDGLTSTAVTATSTAGSVHLDFAVVPSKVIASSTAGSVRVMVPTSQPYHVTASGIDGAKIEVPTDPASPRTIVATSSAGSVRVEPAG